MSHAEQPRHSAAGEPPGHSNPAGTGLEAGLARVAAWSRSHPKEKALNLMPHVSGERIERCLRAIPLGSAPGVDGMTARQAREALGWLLPPQLDAIHGGKYRPPAVRRVEIPKANGGLRPIGVPTVLDRAIQAATAQVLGAVYEQDFQKCSFGFRPNLGCHHALATIDALLGQGFRHVYEVDIRDFFGSLSHEWMRKFLGHRIGDQRVLKLIDAWLKAGVMQEGRWEETEKGTPQGGSISPLLANIYLHYVLDLWFERRIKKQLRGRAQLMRYCDDFVILLTDPRDLPDVKVWLKARLGQFGLEVHEDKTHDTDLTPRSRGGSGARRRMTFLGFAIGREKIRSGRGYKTVFRTEAKRFGRAKARMKAALWERMHWKVEDQAKAVAALLRGHFNYYGLAGNSDRLAAFRYFTVRCWRRCLSRRSQRGRINWEKMRAILQVAELPPARLVIPYSTLAGYVRL